MGLEPNSAAGKRALRAAINRGLPPAWRTREVAAPPGAEERQRELADETRRLASLDFAEREARACGFGGVLKRLRPPSLQGGRP